MTGYIDLLVVGSYQVRTAYERGIDRSSGSMNDGRVHVLELKRDRTPRDVVAQTLDYGSWVQGLGIDDLEQMFLDHHDGDTDLGEAFAEQFASPLPDVQNADQQFTIIASELDPTSDRIVEFLAESYRVPINAVFFRHFSDQGRDYLARTWLLDPERIEVEAEGHTKTRIWNRRDFYTVLGRAGETHRWEVASKYGLHQRRRWILVLEALRSLRPGHRVFAM